MGDGQFVGGGSVNWEVNNTDGESGGGNKQKCKGKDKDPQGADQVFIVSVTGYPPIITPLPGTTVHVMWGNRSLVSPTAASPAAATKKARARRTKAKT